MIVVDSGIWIDFFNGVASPQTDTLDQALGQEEIAVGDIILSEVLQGFRSERQFHIARDLMSSFTLVEMLGIEGAMRSAENYRFLRKKGITVRKTIDTFIATWCINNHCPLLFQDKDYEPFVEHLGLAPASQ